MAETAPGEVAEMDFGRLGLVGDQVKFRACVGRIRYALRHAIPRHHGFIPEEQRQYPGHPSSCLKRLAVQYVRFFKGGTFTGLGDLRSQAKRWCLEIAGQRVHGTTRRLPLVVFREEEQQALLPWDGEPYTTHGQGLLFPMTRKSPYWPGYTRESSGVWCHRPARNDACTSRDRRSPDSPTDSSMVCPGQAQAGAHSARYTPERLDASLSRRPHRRASPRASWSRPWKKKLAATAAGAMSVFAQPMPQFHRRFNLRRSSSTNELAPLSSASAGCRAHQRLALARREELDYSAGRRDAGTIAGSKPKAGFEEVCVLRTSTGRLGQVDRRLLEPSSPWSSTRARPPGGARRRRQERPIGYAAVRASHGPLRPRRRLLHHGSGGRRSRPSAFLSPDPRPVVYLTAQESTDLYELIQPTPILQPRDHQQQGRSAPTTSGQQRPRPPGQCLSDRSSTAPAIANAYRRTEGGG